MEYVCVICGKTKQSNSKKGHQKYCPECKKEAARIYRNQRYAEQKKNRKPVFKKCIYCGKEFKRLYSSQKYCSDECHKKRDAEWAMNKSREGKTRICPICNNELPKFKGKYCSDKCSNRANAIRRGECQDHGLLTKQCAVCGKEFQTFKSRKITCSSECSQIRHNTTHPDKRDKEKRRIYDRNKYLRNHPGALTAEEQREKQRKIRDEKETQRKAAQIARETEWARIRAEKEKKKQENIAYWLKYETEHECECCGKKFIAHYPTAKYCSNACQRRKYKKRRRYKGIMIDSDISLFKLAERDHNQCQICGLFVNWNDYVKTDNATICGDMYPSIDRIKPISLGGLHSWDNVQLAHRGCNTRKRNRYIG